VARLLGQPERLRAMGAAARLRAEARYDVAERARRTEELFRQLTGSMRAVAAEGGAAPASHAQGA
jgi:hypothetical protein